MSSNLSQFTQDYLVSTNNDVAEAIREILEVLFDDALSASVQALGK